MSEMLDKRHILSLALQGMFKKHRAAKQRPYLSSLFVICPSCQSVWGIKTSNKISIQLLHLCLFWCTSCATLHPFSLKSKVLRFNYRKRRLRKDYSIITASLSDVDSSIKANCHINDARGLMTKARLRLSDVSSLKAGHKYQPEGFSFLNLCWSIATKKGRTVVLIILMWSLHNPLSLPAVSSLRHPIALFTTTITHPHYVHPPTSPCIHVHPPSPISPRGLF